MARRPEIVNGRGKDALISVLMATSSAAVAVPGARSHRSGNNRLR
jgi:hypothetical protein